MPHLIKDNIPPYKYIPKTGGKTNICREIKTDYKEAKRLDDLPKVTVSHRQTKHKGLWV